MRAEKIEVRGLPYELYLRNREVIESMAERSRLIRVLLPAPPLPLHTLAADMMITETAPFVVVNLSTSEWTEDGRTILIVEPASAEDVAAIKKWADARKDPNHG